MNYANIIAVTNRHLSGNGDYMSYIRGIASLHPRAVVLREKDMDADHYDQLAGEVKKICDAAGVLLILHYFAQTAGKTGYGRIHLPLDRLRQMSHEQQDYKKLYSLIGVSVHSVQEAQEAVRLGADYIFAGTIYETSCKPGKKPEGIGFLRQVCQSVDIPVYAIGGVTLERMDEILAAGAAGGCMMSGFAGCADNPSGVSDI